MRTQRITFLLAGLLFCWGSVLAKYAIEIGGNGTLTAIADGNTGPYTFEWRDGNNNPLNPDDDTVSELTGLSNGTYYLSIFNGFGCETILEATLGLIVVDIKVFLEGAYDKDIIEMTTILNTERRLLPGQTPESNLAMATPAGQPYAVSPWSYTGTEGSNWTDVDYSSDIVDWVLVSVRSGTAKSTKLESKAGLVKKDGSVFFPEAFSNLSDIQAGYIVVEHRNHLPVMTPMAIGISNNLMSYDFTARDSYVTPTDFGQKDINGIWVMYAGDIDKSGSSRDDISGQDKGAWSSLNGNFNQYANEDLNFDGDINGLDKAIWSYNAGLRSNLNK